MQIDDANRLMALTVNGDSITFSPVAFQADEQISAPFVVSVDAISANAGVDLDTLMFKPACLTLRGVAGTRYFNGMVRSITASGLPVRGMYRYRLSIVPKLWFMGQTTDCRIFQQKTVGDILTTACGEGGQQLTPKIFIPQAPLEYVTQYNESDLQFLSRLMEQAGLFYFFNHTEGGHEMIVSDSNSAFPPATGPVLAVVHEGSNIDMLSEWRRTRGTAYGSVHYVDYDPTAPSTLPAGTTATQMSMAGAPTRNVMQWPALTTDSSVAANRTKYCIEAAEAEVSLSDSAGANCMLMPGTRFKLYRDPFTAASNVEYVVRAVSHHGVDESWVTAGAQPDYGNALSVFPSAVNWRQRIATPRPRMAGIFAATVLGNDGEEIHADSYGRIKVRLLWDHRKDTVADQAVWVRIVQPWAGNSWGWQHLPRVGSEVAVAFMDGDPDRPVVVGGFYNANMAVPFAVPGEQTKSGFRSRSTKAGGTGNFSEFSVDDEMGKELVYLHAEKDMTREVENNDSVTVSNTQTYTVAKGRATTIQDGGDQLAITGGRTTTVKTNDDALTVQTGNLGIKVSMGAVSIEAMQSITLKVGDNTVVIDPSGVAINGIMVKIQGTGMVQAKGPLIQVNADGMLMLKGGIAMVN